MSTVVSKSIFLHIKALAPGIVALNEDNLAKKFLKYVKSHMTRTIAIDGASHVSH
jgi:hypothetical protein